MGRSELRRVESAEAWAQRKGLTLDPMTGRGLSGFKGTHRKKGALGRFLAQVKALGP